VPNPHLLVGPDDQNASIEFIRWKRVGGRGKIHVQIEQLDEGTTHPYPPPTLHTHIHTTTNVTTKLMAGAWVHVYARMGVWMYGCIGVWVYGCMGVWVYGCMGVWVHMGVWVYECMGVWVYGCMCMGVWVYGCGWVLILPLRTNLVHIIHHNGVGIDVTVVE